MVKTGFISTVGTSELSSGGEPVSLSGHLFHQEQGKETDRVRETGRRGSYMSRDGTHKTQGEIGVRERNQGNRKRKSGRRIYDTAKARIKIHHQ